MPNSHKLKLKKASLNKKPAGKTTRSLFTGGGSSNPAINSRTFFYATNWSELWEDWYLAVDEKGRCKYKTLTQFINAYAKSKEQAAFMEWYLGPKRPDDMKPPYNFVTEPQDWVRKRAEGGWLNKATLQAGWGEIKRSTHVLQKVQAVGDRALLDQIARWSMLAERLDAESRGVLFLPDFTMDQNIARARALIGLHHEIQNGINNATEAYLRSQGINLNDLQGLVALLASPAIAAMTGAAVGVAAANSGQLTGDNQLVNALSKMVLEKSAKYGLPLGEEFEQKIIEIAAVEDKPKKKPDVN